MCLTISNFLMSLRCFIAAHDLLSLMLSDNHQIFQSSDPFLKDLQNESEFKNSYEQEEYSGSSRSLMPSEETSLPAGILCSTQRM